MKLFGMRIAKDNVARREAMEIYRTAFSHGAEKERQRIIALLEEEASANDTVNNPYDAGYIRALIGLIKNDYENVIKDKDN
jgi:hypothetical protein